VAGRYQIEFLPSAARELEALPREARGRVADAIEALADEPRPSLAKLLSGTGRERLWRIPVGQYRVLYQVTDVHVTVAIVRVADRREVYNATAIRRLLGRLRGGPR
jgi:mRNA interferase RelE/StbE